jgi:hypothetical protein
MKVAQNIFMTFTVKIDGAVIFLFQKSGSRGASIRESTLRKVIYLTAIL